MHTSFIGLDNLETINSYQTKQLICKGCENNCVVTRFTFPNKSIFYSGNKCEKHFHNKGAVSEKGFSLYEYKLQLLFDRNTKAKGNKRLTIGIPRVLNMYENFPFWCTLFTECGFDVELSSPSTMKIFEKGLGTVMSDSICFPAKLIHGHIFELSDKVDRFFYPLVMFEKNDLHEAENAFNCPIVSSYSDVIKSAINTDRRFNKPLDAPVINFNNTKLLKRACYAYFKELGVKERIFNRAFEEAVTEQQVFKVNLKSKASEIIQNAVENNRIVVVLAGRPYHVDPLINQKTPEILTDLGVDVLTEDSIPEPIKLKLNELQIIPQWNYTNKIYNAAQWVAEQPENFQFVQFNSFGCGPDAIVVDECIDVLKERGKIHTIIRIDEITSTGSVRLRLRSLIESLKLRDNDDELLKKARKTTAIFEESDKHRLILGPYFADIYSDLIPALFACAGFRYENLPKPNKDSVQYGLKYSNNEICYPATLIVGDVIKALQSGKYDRNEVAVAITQTGGQCRASTYLSLIKKAMIAAGFEDIPVVAIGTAGKTINPQPGFSVDWKKVLPVTFNVILYCDSISKMYYSTVVREVKKGQSRELLEKYMKLASEPVAKNQIDLMLELLKKAVVEFNQIETIDKKLHRIGVVGEIYVKYNSFGHQYVVDWLIEQGVEVVVPPIVDFFVQELVNVQVNKKASLTERGFLESVYFAYLEILANRYISKYDKINSKFKHYAPFHKIRHAAESASKILNLVNQFGEGWLIPAEIATFAEEGINNVISLQPFGCIANHVVSKGVEKRIKDLFPKMNLLFLDFDDGASEVNIHNRLHFMVKSVEEYEVS